MRRVRSVQAVAPELVMHIARQGTDAGRDPPSESFALSWDKAGSTRPGPSLDEVAALNADFEHRYASRLRVGSLLTRPLVSFQANKGRAVYRWFKYKEAFSADLIEYLLDRYGLNGGVLLDPFAGSGTSLFAAGGLGIRPEGIELLPIGQRIIKTKQLLDREFDEGDLARLEQWRASRPWATAGASCPINELRITRGAYPQETAARVGRYLAAIEDENGCVREVLFFALLCVLESISFTRKDGQYLRWDYRSGRRVGGKRFDKGLIVPFDMAIGDKLRQIVDDLNCAQIPDSLFAPARLTVDLTLHCASCLDVLPSLPRDSYDCIVTSPPYCNRYDYTRTYALELAMLGVHEAGLSDLRQNMLSCTVENRAKDLLALNGAWHAAIAAADGQPLLQCLLAYLDDQKRLELLNNNGIPRMVRGYFYEMACVIYECARVLKPESPLIMVNDNVRYAGASVSVDIILAEMAHKMGFDIEEILVLPNGKGNSSQQMGAHGRDPLRKCVYVWRKR